LNEEVYIMRTVSALLAIMILTASSAMSGVAGVTKMKSVESHFSSGKLTMERYFSRESVLREKDDVDLGENIYEFGTKSPAKAFMLSLVVPGAGEYYNGQKIKAVSFLAADALFWTGYFIYHKKGVDKENDYKAFADLHYDPDVFLQWWDTVPEDDQNAYSHRLPVDENGMPIRNHEYYENIGKYDQFQVGWEDIGPNYPPEDTSALWGYRVTYLDMRKQSNDYYSRATTMIMVSIANHIVSAFDAAIGAKRFNKGSRQYSMKVDTREINGETMPFLTFMTKF
jgi:hypothetical protein